VERPEKIPQRLKYLYNMQHLNIAADCSRLLFNQDDHTFFGEELFRDIKESLRSLYFHFISPSFEKQQVI
jgi:hypothetical protein